MKKLFYIFIFLFICIHNSTAQIPDKKNSIYFEYGYSDVFTRDELTSPVTYKGQSYPIQLYFIRRGLKNIHRFNVRYNNTKLESNLMRDVTVSVDSEFPRFITHYSDDLRLQFEYGFYRFCTTLLKNKCSLYIGGNWFNFYTNRVFYYNNNHIFHEIVTSLNP